MPVQTGYSENPDIMAQSLFCKEPEESLLKSPLNMQVSQFLPYHDQHSASSTLPHHMHVGVEIPRC